MDLKLKVWRQDNADDKGRIEDYDAKNIPTECSFLEMLDIVNEDLITFLCCFEVIQVRLCTKEGRKSI